MKIKIFAAFMFLCFVSAGAFAQASYAGKWQTDDVPDVQSGKAQSRVGQTMIMDLKLDGTKASGTLNEIGNGDPLTIESGTIDVGAKTLTIVTQPRGVTWNIALTDENTMTVTGRVFAGGGGGRGGGGGGGGRGGGGGAPGGPPAPAPPAAGAAPAPAAPPAPAAAPAGGAPAGQGGGGAPAGGGGRGAGGGGGGRGGGGNAPIVMHRVK